MQQPAVQPQTPLKLEEEEPVDGGQCGGEEGREAINMGRTWNQKELYALAAFFFYNSHKFSSENSKKRWKIYKLMSAFVQTRNINQCRSYTHKLLRSFGSIDKINAFFQGSLPRYHSVLAQLESRNLRLFQHIPASPAESPDASPTRPSPGKPHPEDSPEEEVKSEAEECGYVLGGECAGRGVDINGKGWEASAEGRGGVCLVGWTWTFPQLSFFHYMFA